MKTIIIITGHGGYALGMSGFIKMIAGDIKEMEYIDFMETDTPENIHETYYKKIQLYKNDNVLFICDIAGGTPFKEAVTCAVGFDNVYVIAGANPVSILEASFIKETIDIKMLITYIIENTKNGVLQYSPSQKEDKDDQKNLGI